MFLQRLYELINSRNISKSKLLSDTGINRNAIINWEQRGTVPSGDILVKLADYFGVSTDYLLGRTDLRQADADRGPPDPLLDELLSNYVQLNREGREVLVNTSAGLVLSGQYKKFPPPGLAREA